MSYGLALCSSSSGVSSLYENMGCDISMTVVLVMTNDNEK